MESIVNPIWRPFDPPMVDESIESFEYIEYREKRSGGDGSGLNAISDYEISNTDIDLFLLPSHSFIEAKVIVKDAANVANNITTAGAKIALQNNGWNLFERAQYIINDTTTVEEVRDVGIGTQIKGLIEYSRDYSDSACNQIWYLDTGDGGVNTSLSGGVLSATANAVATTLAILASGEVVTGVGANNEVVVIRFGAADMQVEYNGLSATQALAINGGAQHIDVGGVVGTGSSITIKPAVGPGSYLELYARGKKIKLTGNGTDIIAINEDGTSIGAAVAPDGITARVMNSADKENYFNYGFEERNKLFRTEGTSNHDRQITIYLPLRHAFQIFKSNQTVMRGIKHTIKLDKNKDVNIFHKNSTSPAGTIQFKSLSWWVPKVKPSLAVASVLEAQLAGGATNRLMYERIYVHKSNTYPGDQQNGNYWLINSIGSKPVRLHIVFQYESQYTDQTGNKMIFQNIDVNRMYCELNKKRFPEKEYNLDFTSTVSDYSRLYMQYLDFGNNLYDPDSGASICYKDFGKLYSIFCFDFTKADPMLLQKNKNIDLELYWDLRTVPNPAKPYRIYALVELESELEVSGVSGRMIFNKK